MIQLREHERLQCNGSYVQKRENKYNSLQLVRWIESQEKERPCGYYASFKIGAEWIDKQECLIVTTKRHMEHIDFMRMFMTCFTSNLALDSFSKIYRIDIDKPNIKAPALQSVVSPLIVLHFLGIVSRIKELKKGYIHRIENIQKVKGHILILKNDRTNISTKRYDRVFCKYSEYSVDIPENKLIKKALLFSQYILNRLNCPSTSTTKIKQIFSKALVLFDCVSDEVEIRQVKQLRAHKLFTDYDEAIRLAKLILQMFDYNMSNVIHNDGTVVPFWLDMSLLYEHYVYGLLYEAYREKICYQFQSKTGRPDFLYKLKDHSAILDTKYIPKYENESLDTYVVRQLSGYARDRRILKHLQYRKEAPISCVIIYPKEGKQIRNPFLNQPLEELFTAIPELLAFYKIEVSLPVLSPPVR